MNTNSLRTRVRDGAEGTVLVGAWLSGPGATRRSGAMMCLPAAMLSVLLGAAPALGATSGSRPSVQSQIAKAATSPVVVLRLVDGTTVAGHYESLVGDWSVPDDPAVHYQTWRATHAPDAPEPGQSVAVVRTSGDTLRGSFLGVGPSFIVVTIGANHHADLVSNNDITDLIADPDKSLASWGELRETLLNAPQLVGVALKQGTHTIFVSRETIVSAHGDSSLSSGMSNGTTTAILILVGIAAGVFICVQAIDSASKSAGNSASSSLSTCNDSGISTSLGMRYGSGSVSGGLRPWARTETRRP